MVASLASRKKSSSGGGNTWGDQVGSVSFVVETYDKNSGEIKGKVKHSAYLPEGQEMTVKPQAKHADKFKDNIKKGMGGTAGSVIVLEGCFQKDDVITARWVTTGIAASKVQVEETGHAKRSVERVLIETPRLSFRNPVQAESEPIFINWPINAASAVLYTAGGERKEYDRKWLQEKVKDAKYVNVSALSPDPAAAVAVTNAEEAIAQIEGLVTDANNVAMLRISDGASSEVRRIFPVSTKMGDTYTNDPAAVATKLREKGLFPNLIDDNNELTSLINEGWTLEVIPVRKMVFIGDTQKAVVADMIERDMSQLNNYTARFGDVPNQTTDAIVVLMETSDGASAFAAHPVAVTKDRVPSNFIQTDFIALDAPTQDDTPEASTGQAHAVDDGESFDGGEAFEMIPLSEAETPQEPAPSEPVTIEGESTAVAEPEAAPEPVAEAVPAPEAASQPESEAESTPTPASRKATF